MVEWLKLLLITTSSFSVVDGDTVRLNNGQLVRLTGYNTPEISRPHCPAERELGQRATARLRELTRASKDITLKVTSTSCGYGRWCGTLVINGMDVGETLVKEGLAERMVCAGSRCPKAKDWCHAVQ